MEQFVKGDLLEGANAYHCEKCNKKVQRMYYFVRLLVCGLVVCVLSFKVFCDISENLIQQTVEYI
jgi:ubiquitin C-terminal hydrolase